MPRAKKAKVYAVCRGREGAKIYFSWDECERNVSRYPGAIHQSFTSVTRAEEWMASVLSRNPTLSQKAEVIPAEPRPPRYSPPPNLPPERPSISQMELSEEQQAIMDRVKAGESLFFSGSAGTGKSVLLRAIIHTLGGRSHALGVTGSTGVSAVNIGGVTLHSWTGIGIRDETAEKLAPKIKFNKNLKNLRDRWREVRTLIIDEISMIDGDTFDKIDHLARLVRGNPEEPFGGIQLVLCGDFFQLPPVNKKDKHGKALPIKFAFDAQSWAQCVGEPIMLTRVFRQADQAFAELLNAMRLGVLDAAAIHTLSNLHHERQYDDGVEATELYPLRSEVEISNSRRLDSLPGDTHAYIARDVAGIDDKGNPVNEPMRKRLLEPVIAPPTLRVKVDAQVMLVKNLVQGRLVNGSLGRVVRFMTGEQALMHHMRVAGIQENDGRLDNVDTSQLSDYSRRKRQELADSAEREWPVVRFIDGSEMLCVPQDFTIENSLGEMQAKREQVPLILAWALSIHKSQGQTLERVKVDLARIFEKGQAYVALSRATKLDTLQVLNFNPAKVQAHPRVIEWYRSLELLTLSQVERDDFDNEMDLAMDMM